VDLFLHQLLGGLATGVIYACLALAVVVIYQTIDHFNFAQGEMAMFSTFVAWQLMEWGTPYWAAFFSTVALSFCAGMLIERIVIAPLDKAPVLSHIIVFVGLFAIFNSLAGFIWNFTIKVFPSPFPAEPLFGNRYLGMHETGMMAVVLVVLVCIYGFFRFTRVGLAMRAAAANPSSARLVGIPVATMRSVGWGLASAVGAVAGMMIAPIVFLEPNMMFGILLYGFAGAVLGGLTSPGGAVVGGLIVGVTENLVGTYVPFVGSELKLTMALCIIVIVLLFRPKGLFGHRIVERV